MSLVTVDSTVVQPGALSGRFVLTREIVDSSNPAIDAIAMNAMREDWNGQTEEKAYAALNGAAPSANEHEVTAANLADTDGNVGDVLRSDILANYHFVRHAPPTGALIGQAVTGHLARAKDDTGRYLYPSVGAQNSSGLGNALTQSWNIDGLPHVPAWAITGGSENYEAIILNRADVWAWESPTLMFRFEEKQGPALVELALFGYYAVHVLRPAGIFAVVHEEVI
jgi:hypothetical protein